MSYQCIPTLVLTASAAHQALQRIAGVDLPPEGPEKGFLLSCGVAKIRRALAVTGDALHLHVDVCPSEQVRDESDPTIFNMMGLVFGDTRQFSDVRKYSDTKAKGNSYAKKARVAERLTRAIWDGSLSVLGVCCHGSAGAWYRYGDDLLRTIPDRLIKRESDAVWLETERIPIATARAMGSYAAGLAFICLRASPWARQLEVSRINVLLDTLPSKDAGDASKLLHMFQLHPEMRPAWDLMQSNYGVRFSFADEWSYREPDTDDRPGKQHPGSVLTDWIAQSAYAESNADSWLAKSEHATEGVRQRVLAPYNLLRDKRYVTEMPLDLLRVGLSSTSDS